MAGRINIFVDGDLIAYRCAAAAEKRTVEVTHLPTGTQKIFKTRTEFKKFLKEKNREYDETKYSFKDIQTPESFVAVKKAIDAIIKKIKSFTFADCIEIYIGGGENFRHKLALPTMYKSNREEMARPVLLEKTREYLVKEHKAITVVGEETDDVVTWRAYESTAEGNESIIVTADKDANQSWGCSVLNWTASDWELVNIDLIGGIDKTAIKTAKATRYEYKGTGLKFLAFQLLAGDDADAYWGYKLSKLTYGKANAYKALNDADTVEKIIDVIISEYKRLYPEPITYTDCHGVEQTKNYYDLLKMYWVCACMKRHKNDRLDFDEFLSKYHPAKLEELKGN
jgi:hypothetical protein